MTIFFVSSQDPATEANHVLALQMQVQTDVALFAADATRARLHAAAQDNAQDTLIFAMAHGSLDAVIDSEDQAALLGEDAPHLSGYRIFCWACYTAAGLGAEFAAHGTTWWGYDCALTAPEHREPYAPVFRQLLLEAKQNFSAGVDAITTLDVLTNIKNACLAAEVQLDALGASEDADAMSIYSCCNQMWQHLCVWLSGQDQAIKHPDAPSPSIFGGM